MSYLETPTSNHRGFVVVVVVLISAAVLLMAGYLLEQSRGGLKIAGSEKQASTTYYLTEAGSNDAIYKLKNDATWKAKFLAGNLNNDSFTRSNVFGTGGSYTVTATSVGDALADITVTGTYGPSGQQAKRVIKTRFARATNLTDTWGQSMYGGGTGGQQNGNITVSRNCTENGGTLQANQNFKVTKSTLTVNNAAVAASNNITVNAGGVLVLNNSTRTEGVPSIGMPQIDFDSASLTSLKNRADQTYTSTAFQNLPTGTTLNGVTYVTGNASWTNKNLTINGILASSNDITISLNAGKTLTVNSSSGGSGILAKNDLSLTATGATMNIHGLVYASKNLTLTPQTNPTFTVTGGLIGWHFDVNGDNTGTCSVTYDASLASGPLDPVFNGSESPIIEVNHWEEEY